MSRESRLKLKTSILLYLNTVGFYGNMQAELSGLEAIRKYNRQRGRGWASATSDKPYIKHVSCVVHHDSRWAYCYSPTYCHLLFLQVHLEELPLWKKTRTEGGKGFHNKLLLLKRGCELRASRFKKALSELFPPIQKPTLRLGTCATLWHGSSTLTVNMYFAILILQIKCI